MDHRQFKKLQVVNLIFACTVTTVMMLLAGWFIGNEAGGNGLKGIVFAIIINLLWCLFIGLLVWSKRTRKILSPNECAFSATINSKIKVFEVLVPSVHMRFNKQLRRIQLAPFILFSFFQILALLFNLDHELYPSKISFMLHLVTASVTIVLIPLVAFGEKNRLLRILKLSEKRHKNEIPALRVDHDGLTIPLELLSNVEGVKIEKLERPEIRVQWRNIDEWIVDGSSKGGWHTLKISGPESDLIAIGTLHIIREDNLVREEENLFQMVTNMGGVTIKIRF
jgi:hypothetical protein